jgi:hypothetical protein
LRSFRFNVITGGEKLHDRLDIRILREGALAMTYYKKDVYSWLAQHDTNWALANVIQFIDRRPSRGRAMINALEARGIAVPTAAKSTLESREKPVAPPPTSAPVVSPVVPRAPPVPLPTISAEQSARLASLRDAFAEAIREGGTYQDSDQDSGWSTCVFRTGRFVWTSGYAAINMTNPALEFLDAGELAKHVTSGYQYPAHAIDALERALRQVQHVKPTKSATAPEPRFKNPGLWGIHLKRYASHRVKQGFLDASMVIDGHEWICEIAFYESGRLRAGRLRNKAVIQGVPCTGIVSFRETGELRSVKLSEDSTLGAWHFRGGQQVDLDEHGQPRTGSLAATRAFIRIDEAGTARTVQEPPLAKTSWERTQKSRRHYLWVSLEGVVAGSASGPFDDNAGQCTLREFLHGAFCEGIRNDFGIATLKEIRASAEILYRVISDEPLDFEVET